MDMRKYAGETFLKVDDVRDQPLRLQIALVKEGRFDKPDLIFETGEVFTLNTANTKTLIRAYGPDDAGWIGKEVELHLGQVPYQGKPTDSVVVKPISPALSDAERQQAEARSAVNSRREMNDDIPF